MTGMTRFTIGSEAVCSDGVCGEVTRVVVDPIVQTVTHLVVSPSGGAGTWAGSRNLDLNGGDGISRPTRHGTFLTDDDALACGAEYPSTYEKDVNVETV